ncbi:c-di-GMP phosphodiesterase [Novacetimonas pomaceti]|uniref:C-di-GMP phosphodiesterase n=2 Tax=Novacetimonas pomaceti TaxID=2021998 RepID=A0ABX5P8D9_9PROT|nr:c-di-GMP phosphodiesterase [Novacetimonas pomaceti]
MPMTPAAGAIAGQGGHCCFWPGRFRAGSGLQKKNDDMTAYTHSPVLQHSDLVLQHVPEAVVLINDRNDIVFYNDAAQTLWGIPRAEVMGKNVRCLVPPPYRADHDDFIARHRQSGKDHTVGTTRDVEFVTAGGETRRGRLSLSQVVRPGQAGTFYMGIMADVTQDYLAESILQLRNDLLRSLVSEKLPLDQSGEFLCRRIENTITDCCAVLLHPGGHDGRVDITATATLPRRMRNALAACVPGPAEIAAMKDNPAMALDLAWTRHTALARAFGFIGCEAVPVATHDGTPAGILAIYLRDAGQMEWARAVVKAALPFCTLALGRDAARQRISELSERDTLTGLLNRSSLNRYIVEMASDRQDAAFTVMVLNIDSFRDINNALGHIHADNFLRVVAKRLEALSAGHFIISRSSGDEFIVLIPDCPRALAMNQATRIIRAVADPIEVNDSTITLSVSIGIACYPDDGPDGESLLGHADLALQQAKSEGRGTYKFADSNKNRLAQDRLLLGSALHETVSKGQLHLHYQPQIDTMTGALYGVEALARWHHPHLGNIFPSRFIAVAEETGQIAAIGRWSLREACRQMGQWDRDGIHVPTVAVNLSAAHFGDHSVPEYIAGLLRTYDLTPDRLTVEITENVMMESGQTTHDVLQAIRDLGVGLSMDDFGTGYSSLSRLTRLPLTEIKIDRSFINDFEHDTNAQAVTTAVIGIGNRLGMTVVTEGVETEQQRQLLEDLKCDVMQGYLFARPLPADELEKWIRARS